MPTATTQERPTSGGHTLTPSLVAICIGFFLIQLDATIVNVALPSIGRSIGGSISGLQWVVDGYTLTLAALMLTAGSTADRIGAKRLFSIGVVIFTVGSAGCAVAPNLAGLLAARVLQGLGAAALLPSSLALIVHAYPEPSQRARALGSWGAMGSIGVAAGPVLGGALVAAVGWRGIFLVNVPVGLVELWLLQRYVTESPGQTTGPLDWRGLVTSMTALAALAGGFIESGQHGWGNGITLGLLAVGILLALAFLRIERNRRNPMVPLAIFTSKPFSYAVSIGLCFNLGLYGSLLCLSIYLQDVRGTSPLTTGLLLLPMAAMVAGGSLISGRLTARTGPRRPMIAGLLIAAAGAAILAMVGAHSLLVLLIAGSLALGLCSLAMPAMSALAVGSVEAERAGLASGIFNTSRQAGGALGVAILGSLLVTGGHRPALGLPLSVAAGVLVVAAFLAWHGTTAKADSSLQERDDDPPGAVPEWAIVGEIPQ